MFSRRSSGFRGSSSRDKKDDQNGCFNYKNPSHFIIVCLELQKDKSKKIRYQKDNFRNKVKKSLMETWDKLVKEEETEKDDEEANLALIALTSSDTKSDSDSCSDSDE